MSSALQSMGLLPFPRCSLPALDCQEFYYSDDMFVILFCKDCQVFHRRPFMPTHYTGQKRYIYLTAEDRARVVLWFTTPQLLKHTKPMLMDGTFIGNALRGLILNYQQTHFKVEPFCQL